MKPRKFNNEKDQKINDMLCVVYEALEFKKYNAFNQIRDYLYTEDPIYITTYNKARELITSFDRGDIMNHILDYYFNG